MNIDELKISEPTEFTKINVDITPLNKITEIIKLAFNKALIPLDGMQIYYQRNNDATSVLAIQVEQENNTNMNNYMINGCKAWLHSKDITCDVYMHANKKSAQKAMKLANFISNPIVDFFNEFEKGLLKTNNFDISLSITIPLSIPKEENSLNRLIRRIGKKQNQQ